MSYYVIRTSPSGRQYRYRYTSLPRKNGKAQKKIEYLGPVGGLVRKKKRGGLGGLTVPTFVMSAVVVAAKSIAGTLGPPGGTKYPERHHKPVSRAEQVYRAQERQLNARAGMDMSSREAYEKSLAHMTPETYQEWIKNGMELSRTMHAAKNVERQTKEVMSMAGYAPTAPAKEASVSDPSDAAAADSEVSSEGEE